LKRNNLVAVTIVAAVLSAGIARAEKYTLVQKSDYAKTISYEVMTETAFQELAAKYTRQSLVFNKALSMSEKKWREEDSYKSSPFPKNNLAAPRALSLGTFDDEAKANSRKEPLQKKIDDAIAAKKDAEAKEAKREAEKKKKDAAKKQPAKKTDKKDVKLTPEQVLDRAAKLVEANIDELMAAADMAGEKAEEVLN
jgi:uncharacterized protein (DUF1501 family)